MTRLVTELMLENQKMKTKRWCPISDLNRDLQPDRRTGAPIGTPATLNVICLILNLIAGFAGVCRWEAGT